MNFLCPFPRWRLSPSRDDDRVGLFRRLFAGAHRGGLVRDLNELNPLRAVEWELRAHGVVGDKWGGCFIVNYEGVELRIIASSGGKWDHISVSTESRCPTWAELEFVRKLFAKPAETWMQLHVPESEHVNHHPYCLHLWRPHFREIPRPPAIFVGPAGVRA